MSSSVMVARTRRGRTIVGFETSKTSDCCVVRIVCESVLLPSQASHSISESRPGSPGAFLTGGRVDALFRIIYQLFHSDAISGSAS